MVISTVCRIREWEGTGGRLVGADEASLEVFEVSEVFVVPN